MMEYCFLFLVFSLVRDITTLISVLQCCRQILFILAMNSHIVGDNYLMMVLLINFFTIQTNLIKGNVFHNHIFIYYRNNHKCNIETITNINFVIPK